MTDETRAVLPVRALRAAFSLFAWWVRRVAEENPRTFGGGLEASTMPPIRVVLLLFLCLNEVLLLLVGRLEVALTTAERGVFPRVERGVFLAWNFADWQYPRWPFPLRDGRLPACVGNALVLFVLWVNEVLPRVL